MTLHHPTAAKRLLLATLTSVCGCQLKLEPEPSLQQLGPRVRVLAMQSDPADVIPGDSVRLRALVHEHCDDGEPVEYAWSWCPLRDEVGLECAFDEAALAEAWDTLGLGGAPPPFDLGDSPEPTVWNVLSSDVTQALCARYDGSTQRCFDEIGLSIRLTVRQCGNEDTALRLLPVPADPSDRNSNPDPSGSIGFRHADRDAAVSADALVRGENYIARSEFDIPIDCDGQDAASPCQAELLGSTDQREEVRSTWFLTHGAPFREEATQGAAGLSTDINGYGLPDPAESFVVLEDEDSSGAARAYIVVQDERGGVGWAMHTFTVVEPEEGS